MPGWRLYREVADLTALAAQVPVAPADTYGRPYTRAPGARSSPNWPLFSLPRGCARANVLTSTRVVPRFNALAGVIAVKPPIPNRHCDDNVGAGSRCGKHVLTVDVVITSCEEVS